MRIFWLIFGIPLALVLIIAMAITFVISAAYNLLILILNSIPEPGEQARLK